MRKLQQGFSLIEIAVVLFIVGLLTAGLLPTLTSQIEQRRRAETNKQLEEVKEALMGYASIYGRLPCPASTTSNGAESFAAGGDASNGNCSNFYDGFVPAATLGITTTVDSSGNKGYAVDSWGNRIRYAVTSWNSNTFTKTNGIANNGISTLSPNLLVCASAAPATGFTGSTCGSSSNALTSSPGVPVVLFSLGNNGGYGGTSTDEAANATGSNRTFVSHTFTPVPNEFDDLVIWISPNTLINRMVSAGKLP